MIKQSKLPLLPLMIKKFLVFLEDRLTSILQRLDRKYTKYRISFGGALNAIGSFYLHTAQNA